MASTFSQQKVSLDEIAANITDARNKLNQCKSLATLTVNQLGGLATTYSGIVADIDAALVAEPDNAAVMVLKAEKDKLVAEFVALQTAASSMQTAVNAVTY